MFNGDHEWSEINDALYDRRPRLIAAVETIQAYLPEVAKRLASELKNADEQVVLSSEVSSDERRASGTSKLSSLHLSQS